MDYEVVEKLEDMNGGVVKDLWPDALAEILENIGDENTPAQSTREINLKISFKPTKTRDSAYTTVEMKTKLAPPKANESVILLSNDGKVTKAYARQHDPEQMGLEVVDFPSKEVK